MIGVRVAGRILEGSSASTESVSRAPNEIDSLPAESVTFPWRAHTTPTHPISRRNDFAAELRPMIEYQVIVREANVEILGQTESSGTELSFSDSGPRKWRNITGQKKSTGEDRCFSDISAILRNGCS